MLGENKIDFSASFLGIAGKKSAVFLVRPDLNVFLGLPSEVALGDVLDLKGFVKAKKSPVGINLDANVLFQGKSIFNSPLVSDSATGNFDFYYPVSLLSKLGAYTVLIQGFDGNGNRAFFEKSFEVREKVFTKKLLITIGPFEKQSFSRGSEVPVVLSLFDEAGNIVEKADVFISVFGEKTQLFEFEPGKYSVSVRIPLQATEGGQSFSISAVKKEGSVVLAEAIASGSFAVEKTAPILEMISPKADSFKIGDTIDFEVLAYYPSREKVVDAKAFVLLGTKEILLNQTMPGRYVGSYLVADSDAGEQDFSVKVVDSYGNTVSIESKFAIGGAFYRRQKEKD